jgi:hypothetical protein
MEITRMMLLDFYQYIERLVAIKPPHPHRLKACEVYNEEENFFLNARLLADLSVYLRGCFELYRNLTKQVTDLVIEKNNIATLTQYLSRIRLNISNLIYSLKNQGKNYQSDIIKYNNELELSGYMTQIKSDIFPSGFLAKLNHNLHLSTKGYGKRYTDDFEKVRRLNYVLDK